MKEQKEDIELLTKCDCWLKVDKCRCYVYDKNTQSIKKKVIQDDGILQRR